MLIKYKISDLAKDFNLQSKVVIDLLAQKTKELKKHTAVLDEPEINLLIEKLTKTSEIADISAYLNSAPKHVKPAVKVQAKEVPVAAKTPVAATPASPLQVKQAPSATPPNTARTAQFNQRVAAAPQEPPKQQKKTFAKPRMETLVPTGNEPKTEVQKRNTDITVDTRTTDVNLEKFNDRYEEIAKNNQTTSSNLKRSNDTQSFNKQKFGRNNRFGSKQVPFQKKRETEQERLQRIQLEKARNAQLKVSIPEEIAVAELASRLKATSTDVIKRLMKLGVMASVSDVIDFDTASLIADEMGAKATKEVKITIEERLFNEPDDDTNNSYERSPVVVVMGHVDHGKTSILDAIRETSVTAGEAGGITQHIGAYQVVKNGKTITFLDTPGHEAFTSMRARGASITDIAILVVAADDGIMPQTIEAIHHAKAAGVSVIVAINKMDKESANPERVKQELTEYELLTEEWGGDTICCNVSAVTGEGIPHLLDMVTLVSDIKELKCNPARRAKGTVIEARLDKGQGPISTILVQNGTLKKGDIVIAGTAVGRVRTMTNDKGERLEEAGPSTPVEITGLTEVPAAGDVFEAVEDERLARELASKRGEEIKQEKFDTYKKVTLENLFTHIASGQVMELPIVVKADVQGSAQAVRQSLEKLSFDEVRVKVIHSGVGAINKSDVMLANAAGGIIIGFNVRPDAVAKAEADEANIELRMYRVIYDAIDDVKAAMKGMLAPKIREVILGRIEVRLVYKISSAGTIAGCYVLDGKVTRNSKIRLVRDNVVIAEDEIYSLKRFKDDVKEVATGYECGIGLAKYNDIKESDIFEAFILEEYRD